MIYRFTDFTLDVGRRVLQRGDESIAVEPQVFDLLQYLIENRSRVVSKDDLISGVWNGRIVSDSALSSRMTAVRQAIGDSGEMQRCIRTIPRKGFRFVGEVLQHSNDLQPNSPPPPAEVALGLMLPDKPSIAVLAFKNLSNDVAQEYFVDGVVEDITTALAQFSQLFVVARSSSFTYKGRDVDVKRIGRELGVRYVLDGSLRKAAGRLRIVSRAVALGRDDAVALSAAGMALGLVVRDLTQAVVLLDRSVLLNPNLAASWVRSAWVRLFSGHFDLAIEHASRAIRLSPLDPLLVGMQTVIAFAHFCAGRYEEAVQWSERALGEQPNFTPALRVLVASNASRDQMEDAARGLARLRELHAVTPISEGQFPFQNPNYSKKYSAALRKAGFAV